MKINLVTLNPGSWGTSLPCQVFTALQGPGKSFSSTTCSQWGLWLCWSKSCGCIVWKSRRALAQQALDHQLSLVPQWPWHAAVLLWSAGCWHLWEYMPRWGGFCKTGNLVLLKAEETKAYQYHLGAERPQYCLISHAELEFQFKGVFFLTKLIAF